MSKIMKELKGLSSDELKSRSREMKKELMKLNSQVSTGTAPANPGKLKQIKKSLARMRALLHQHEVVQ
ncbi:50S ribosomal protein L29 [Candidatus Woesearchaeota archaeon]|nr:50S ribosomal protein L29 [Candidatus Woesearchaeota archaeon]